MEIYFLHERNLPDLYVEAPNDVKLKFNHYVGNKYQIARGGKWTGWVINGLGV